MIIKAIPCNKKKNFQWTNFQNFIALWNMFFQQPSSH